MLVRRVATLFIWALAFVAFRDYGPQFLVAFNIVKADELHAVSVWIMLAEAIMAIRPRSIQYAQISEHISFGRTNMAAKICTILCNEYAAIPSRLSAIVEAVDCRQIFDWLIMRVVNCHWSPLMVREMLS